MIGLGVVGLPTAEYLGGFYEVYGYDMKPRKGISFISVLNPNQVEADVFVICVPTNQVENVCGNLNRDKLILIESTMQIGSCKRISQSLPLLAHCPHRYWEESPEEHGVRQTRVLGAVNEESLKRAKNFYEGANIPVYIVSSIEIAEASKIVENSNRFVNIAFSEEVKMICEEIGLNFEEVRQACNTKWNIHVFEAREGIGGVCLPQDIGLLSGLCGGDLLEAAVKTDEKYRTRLA